MLRSPVGRSFRALLFQSPISDYLQPSPTPTFGDEASFRLSPLFQKSSPLRTNVTPHTSSAGSQTKVSGKPKAQRPRKLKRDVPSEASPSTSALGQCMTISYTEVQNNKEGFRMLKNAFSSLGQNKKWMLYIQIPVQTGKGPEVEYGALTELWEKLIEYGIEEKRIGDLVAVDVDRYSKQKKAPEVEDACLKARRNRPKAALSRASRIQPASCGFVLPTVERLTLRGSFRNFFPFPVNIRNGLNPPLTFWGINFASLTTLILDCDLPVDDCIRIFRSCVNLETLAFRLNDELPFVQHNFVRMDKLKRVVIVTDCGEGVEKFLRRLDAPLEFLSLCVGKSAARRLAKKEPNHVLRRWTMGTRRVVIRCPRTFIQGVRANVPPGIKNVEFPEYRGLDMSMTLDLDPL